MTYSSSRSIRHRCRKKESFLLNSAHIYIILLRLRYGFVIYSPEHSDSICDVMWSDPNLMRCNTMLCSIVFKYSRRAKSMTVVAWTTAAENGWQFLFLGWCSWRRDFTLRPHERRLSTKRLRRENIDTGDVKRRCNRLSLNLFTNTDFWYTRWRP